MTRRKSTKTIQLGLQQGSPRRNQDYDPEIVKSIIKSVLIDSDILLESLNEKQIPTSTIIADQDKLDTGTGTYTGLVNQLKADGNFIDSLSNKICLNLIENDTFKQAMLLEFKQDMEALEKQVTASKQENQELQTRLELQEQYSRRNCLIIHGLSPPAEGNEKSNTNDIVKTLLKDQLNISVRDYDIDRSHYLGKPGAQSPIIVKFVRHDLKNLIYNSKKKLKGKGVVITEALTPRRLQCIKGLKKLQNDGVVLQYWTFDGKIYYTTSRNPGKKVHLDSLNVDMV